MQKRSPLIHEFMVVPAVRPSRRGYVRPSSNGVLSRRARLLGSNDRTVRRRRLTLPASRSSSSPRPPWLSFFLAASAAAVGHNAATSRRSCSLPAASRMT